MIQFFIIQIIFRPDKRTKFLLKNLIKIILIVANAMIILVSFKETSIYKLYYSFLKDPDSYLFEMTDEID